MIRNSLGKLKVGRLVDKTEMRTLAFAVTSHIKFFSKPLPLFAQIMSPGTFPPAICSKPAPFFRLGTVAVDPIWPPSLHSPSSPHSHQTIVLPHSRHDSASLSNNSSKALAYFHKVRTFQMVHRPTKNESPSPFMV